MLLGDGADCAHVFGALGPTIETARQSAFFQWFHFGATEPRHEPVGALTRFRPSGEHVRDRCYLDVLTTDRQNIACLELVVERAFLDGRDALFAQDLVKSFLQSALTDACRDLLKDFLAEVSTFGGGGATPGYLVYRGHRSAWNVETGWSRLRLANLTTGGAPSLVVNVGANPKAPNAVEDRNRWYRRLRMPWLFSAFSPRRRRPPSR